MNIFMVMFYYVAAVKCSSESLTRSSRAWAECEIGSQCVPMSHCGLLCDLIKYTHDN